MCLFAFKNTVLIYRVLPRYSSTISHAFWPRDFCMYIIYTSLKTNIFPPFDREFGIHPWELGTEYSLMTVWTLLNFRGPRMSVEIDSHRDCFITLFCHQFQLMGNDIRFWTVHVPHVFYTPTVFRIFLVFSRWLYYARVIMCYCLSTESASDLKWSRRFLFFLNPGHGRRASTI